MRRWLLNTALSLVIGGAFLWLAVRDWSWSDILESLEPLDPGRVWLSAELEAPQSDAVEVSLLRDGQLLVRPRLPASPAGRVTVPLALPEGTDPTGWWTLEAPAGAGVTGWSLDFRPPEERARRTRPADPLVFAAAPARDGRLGPVRVTGVDWIWLIPYLLVFVVVHLSRVVRWGVLLRPLARLSFPRLMAVASVGFMAIILLPLRLGEFVRPYLVTEDGASFSGALGTCFVERVLDGLMVTGLLFLSVFLVKLSGVEVPAGIYLAGYVALAVFAGSMTVLVLARWKREATLAILHRLAAPISRGLADKGTALVRSFLDGLNALPDARLVAAIIGLTFLYWGINIVGFWSLFQAVGLTAPDGTDLDLLAAATFMPILAIGIIIPAGPGFAGNFEAAGRLGLSVFVVTEVLLTRGAVYILLLHALQFFLQVGVGFVFLLSGRISFSRAVADSARAARELE